MGLQLATRGPLAARHFVSCGPRPRLWIVCYKDYTNYRLLDVPISVIFTRAALETAYGYLCGPLLKILDAHGVKQKLSDPYLFHCFTVHFDSLSFIHTNSCTFSHNYVSVF